MQLGHSRRPCSPRGGDQSHGRELPWLSWNAQKATGNANIAARAHSVLSSCLQIKVNANWNERNAPHTNLGSAIACCLEGNRLRGACQETFSEFILLFFVIRNVQSPPP